MKGNNQKKKRGIFAWYFQTSLLTRIFVGLILGAIVGLAVGPEIAVINPLGVILVRLLKMIVMPVVISTLVVGAGSIHPAQLGRVGAKALGVYMITTAFAVALGLAFGNLFQPGKGMVLMPGSGEGIAGTAMKTPSLVMIPLQVMILKKL